jgi:integrase/recombinase XerD
MADRKKLSEPSFHRHLEFLEASGDYSQVTISLALAWLLRFEEFCGKRCPLSLQAKDLEDWHKLLTWTPGPSGKLYSQNTVNQAVGTLRRLYRWLLAEGELETDPTRTLLTVKPKRVSQKPEFSVNEKRQLLASPNKETATGIRDRALLGVLLETRASYQACSAIDLKALCFDTGALLTRGRQQQIHSLSFGVLADLERYLNEARPLLIQAPNKALFLNQKGERLSKGSVHQVMLRHRKFCEL